MAAYLAEMLPQPPQMSSSGGQPVSRQIISALCVMQQERFDVGIQRVHSRENKVFAFGTGCSCHASSACLTRSLRQPLSVTSTFHPPSPTLQTLPHRIHHATRSTIPDTSKPLVNSIVTQPKSTKPPIARAHSSSSANMSLRIVPAPGNPTSTHAQIGAPSAPGVHDTLRSNLSLSTPAPKATSGACSSTSPLQSTHPLESRLSSWRAQQESLKMELLRRQFGIAEPVKRQMELSIVRAGEWQPSVLGGFGTAGLHADILAGRDCEIGWEDVFTGEEMRDVVDFHTEMEGRFGMNW